MIKALEEFAEVYYWKNDGNILEILKSIKFKPDFILHYEVGWNNYFAPKIKGLNRVKIPKGAFVNDERWNPDKRRKYFHRNKIDLIFSTYKYPFLNRYPEFSSKFRWVPFSVNTEIIKDWKLEKSYKFLLMGKVYYDGAKTPAKGRYPFRDEVLNKMQFEEGFVFRKHPGHFAKPATDLLVNEVYAKELNRSEIFFTCGSIFEYSVMKYFEAPGCHTLLLAESNQDIIDLGFKDGVNFVACTKDDFYEKALFYSNNKHERERIIKNGYDFIHSYHTNQIRAQEIVSYIESFINGDKKINGRKLYKGNRS